MRQLAWETYGQVERQRQQQHKSRDKWKWKSRSHLRFVQLSVIFLVEKELNLDFFSSLFVCGAYLRKITTSRTKKKSHQFKSSNASVHMIWVERTLYVKRSNALIFSHTINWLYWNATYILHYHSHILSLNRMSANKNHTTLGVSFLLLIYINQITGYIINQAEKKKNRIIFMKRVRCIQFLVCSQVFFCCFFCYCCWLRSAILFIASVYSLIKRANWAIE